MYRDELKLGTKLDIVRCLEDVIEEQTDITPIVELSVLYGPANHRVRAEACRARTFREYAFRGST